MYKLKDAVRRGSALLGAAGLVASLGASAIPALVPAAVSADALNPLTKRSLTLSSSSPGWSYVDGSGNTTYAPPNSGANGKQTGNTFSFHNSTGSGSIKTMSFQYCTDPAGDCISPGNNANTAGTGTITTTTGALTVAGIGTHFLTEEPLGTEITTAGGYSYKVANVTDDNNLTLTASSGSATATGAGAAESGVTFTHRGADDVAGQKSDLNVAASSPTEVAAGADFNTVVGDQSDTTNPNGNVSAVPGVTDPLTGGVHPITTGQYAAHAVAGNFLVMYDDTVTTHQWTYDPNWTMSVANVENTTNFSPLEYQTGKNNYIVLTKTSGSMSVPFDTPIKVIFFGRTNNYITNPGASSFFVKINTYSNTYDGSTTGHDLASLEPASNANVIDGGVTVANVMNQSIEIQTKVLETMQFSVGTVDPDTLTDAQLTASDNGSANHQTCDTILTRMKPTDSADVLLLGKQAAESSLETQFAYATHSYWRLSSNSSAGATVYYSGHTLSDTEGDQIAPIGTTAKQSAPGSEQFGLALDTATYAGGHGFDDATYGVDYTTATGGYENGADNSAAGIIAANPGTPIAGIDNSVFVNNGAAGAPGSFAGLKASFHDPRLNPLTPETAYGGGAGTITNGGTAQFAFDANSDTIPAPLATESSQVVDCVTGKMRYIANIAAITPAGIYTTKVNYIAAPQY